MCKMSQSSGLQFHDVAKFQVVCALRFGSEVVPFSFVTRFAKGKIQEHEVGWLV